MKFLTDFHTHTTYSRRNHGKGSIEENVEAAIRKGLKELWITDHGPGHVGFGILKRKFPEVRKEIDRLNIKYAGKIKIFFGVEANVMNYSGGIDIGEREKKYLDGINVGFHYGTVPNDLKSIYFFFILNPLAKIFKGLREFVREKNTDALIEIVKKHKIKIITHPSDKVPVNIRRLAETCQIYGTALEINSSHTHMNEDEIREAMVTDVLISVGSDAHSPKRVGDFERAIKRIENTGLSLDRIINLKE